MTGAALLAASAALHAGAGRVLVALLDDGQMAIDMAQPELMFRRFDALALEQLTVVCGCGGGEAVRAVLPAVLARAARLVLDADALNALATDAALRAEVVSRAERGLPTVLTPHPLEAARLLGVSAVEVQADRLNAAQQLAEQAVTAVEKGQRELWHTLRDLRFAVVNDVRVRGAKLPDIESEGMPVWVLK